MLLLPVRVGFGWLFVVCFPPWIVFFFIFCGRKRHVVTVATDTHTYTHKHTAKRKSNHKMDGGKPVYDTTFPQENEAKLHRPVSFPVYFEGVVLLLCWHFHAFGQSPPNHRPHDDAASHTTLIVVVYCCSKTTERCHTGRGPNSKADTFAVAKMRRNVSFLQIEQFSCPSRKLSPAPKLREVARRRTPPPNDLHELSNPGPFVAAQHNVHNAGGWGVGGYKWKTDSPINNGAVVYKQLRVVMKPSQLRHFLPFRQLGLWLAGALSEQETSMFRWFGHAATATSKSRTGVTIVCVSGFMALYVCTRLPCLPSPLSSKVNSRLGKSTNKSNTADRWRNQTERFFQWSNLCRYIFRWCHSQVLMSSAYYGWRGTQ